MVARSVAATSKIHGSSYNTELLNDGACEPVETDAKYVDVWKYFIIARIALDSPPSSWSEVSRNLQYVKLRSRIPN